MQPELEKQYMTQRESRIPNPTSSDDRPPYPNPLGRYAEQPDREAEHDQAAEELLHSRIRQLEQKISTHEYREKCFKQSVEYNRDENKKQQSRITSLERQLDETQRMMISDNGVAQTRIANLESAVRSAITEAQYNRANVSLMFSAIVLRELEVVVKEEPPFILADDSISSWLHKLPDGYRELALANYAASNTKYMRADSVSTALWLAFSWIDSPEGGLFWKQVADSYEGPSLPELPAGH